jgi:hypothetical protein
MAGWPVTIGGRRYVLTPAKLVAPGDAPHEAPIVPDDDRLRALVRALADALSGAREKV